MILWIDLETEGLDPAKHRILEACAVLTDDDLNVVDVIGPVCAKPLRPVVLDDFVQRMHTESGLLAELEGSYAYGIYDWAAQVQQRMMSFEQGTVPLGGSSVHFDRSFLDAYVPMVTERLSYRNIDVSTIAELAKRWRPDTYERRPASAKAHRALADIMETIELARFFRSELFTHEAS